MNTQHESTRKEERHRQGQTLAEFALTLPILLLLLFGIVEFGRIFQAWVTIQNSARVAVRYASTGQWNQDKYASDEVKTELGYTDLDAEWGDAVPLVPCSQDIGYNNNQSSEAYPRFDPSQMAGTYNNDNYYIPLFGESGGVKSEHIFKTMYNISDCDPADTDSLQYRQDIMRLVSIYDEARRGAAGLAIEPTRVDATQESIWEFVQDSFARPSVYDDGDDEWDYERRSWFDVNVCSSRPKMYGDAQTEVRLDVPNVVYGASETLYQVTEGSRFWSVPPDLNNDNLRPASCILVEVPTQQGRDEGMAVFDVTTNLGVPWMDAGGSGDRVTVVVTFNHPLITPLPLADYIQMSARRSAVNESFRVSNAERALGPSGAGLGAIDPTDSPDTETPVDTNTPVDTDTPVWTDTPEDTPTAEPFDCDKLSVHTLTFDRNNFYIEFENGNIEDTELERAIIQWQPDDFLPDYPDVNLYFMALDDEIIWFGDGTYKNDRIDTLNDPFTGGPWYVGGMGTGTDPIITDFKGVFDSAPQLLFEYTDMWAFSGTAFYFDDLAGGSCIISLDLPPTPEPATEYPADFTPSPTWTPDCASDQITVEFVSFDSLGDVRLRVTNNRSVVSPMYGALIYFSEYPGLGLTRIVAGGSNANDIITSGGTGVVVWSAGASTGITTSPVDTYSSGTWQVNYNFQPGVTDLHLDFTGVGASTLPGSIPGYDKSYFNGTRFDIGCDSGGTGNGGNWGGSSGSIYLFNNPTPVPTSPPLPTRTPAPTYTPSNTPLPVTPSNTWTPRPATETPLPSDTPEATDTYTPSPTPTRFGGGTQG